MRQGLRVESFSNMYTLDNDEAKQVLSALLKAKRAGNPKMNEAKLKEVLGYAPSLFALVEAKLVHEYDDGYSISTKGICAESVLHQRNYTV